VALSVHNWIISVGPWHELPAESGASGAPNNEESDRQWSKRTGKAPRRNYAQPIPDRDQKRLGSLIEATAASHEFRVLRDSLPAVGRRPVIATGEARETRAPILTEW
jgi:hypothetical protein